MKIHTIVLFIFVTRLPERSTQTDFFTAGVYTVTQEALDEAPERYGRFLLQILDEMQTVQVPPVEDWDNCNVRYRVGPAKQNSSIQLITNSLKLTLASDNQLNVSAQAKVSIPAATKISKCYKILFWCVSLKVCDEIAYYNAVLSISLTLQVNWDVTSKQLKLSVGNLSIPPTTPDIQGCYPSGIVDYFIKWHDILNEKVQQAVTIYVSNFEKSFSIPPTIELSQGLFTNYTVQDIHWRAGDSATVVANAVVFGEINGQYVTYKPDQREANLPIAVEAFPKTDSTDPQSHLLQASRLSSVFLTGLVWYAEQTGQLFYHNNATVLDSFLNITMFLAPPGIDIPRNGTINVTITNGSFDAMCRQVGTSHPRQLIKILYNDLQGSGALMYTNDTSPGVILQLVDLIFDYMTLQPVEPKIPLPPSLEYGIVKNAINQSKPLINTFLSNNPLIIPGNIKPYVAHPVLDVFAGVPLVTVGYMQISSYCSCKKSAEKFVACGQNSGICPSSKLSLSPNLPLNRISQPTSELFEQQRAEDAGFLAMIIYDNGDCNLFNSTAGLYNIKVSDGKCIEADKFSGYRYKLQSKNGPLHWNCVDSSCLNCQIITNHLTPNQCYGRFDFSLSVGTVCQQDEYVTKDSLIIQQYTTQWFQNCSDNLVIGPVTGLAVLQLVAAPQGQCVPYSGAFGEITTYDQRKHFNVSLFCSNKNCSNCNISQTNVAIDQCFQSYFKLKASPQRCKVRFPWLHVIIATISTVFLLVALFSVDSIFFKFNGCKYIFRTLIQTLTRLWFFIRTDLSQFVCRAAQKAFQCLKKSCSSIRTWMKENLGVRREFNVEDVFQTILCILCSAIVLWQRNVWLNNDTVFLLFTGNITGKFNIPDNLVDTKNVNEYFKNWESIVSKSMEISGACLWIPILAYAILVRFSFNYRTLPRILAITACLICSLAVPMLPLFVQDMGALIHIGSKNATGIDNSKILHYVQIGLQESFTGLVSACFAGLVMNLFQGLNAGMFLAVLIHEMIYKPVRSKSIIIHQMYNLISFGTVLQVFFSIHPVIVWTQYSSTHASFFLYNAFLWVLPLLAWILKTVLTFLFQNHFPASRFISPTVFIFITCYVIATNRVVEMQKRYYNYDQMEDFIITQLVATIVLVFSITYMFLSIGHHDESYYFALSTAGCVSVRKNNHAFQNLDVDVDPDDNDGEPENQENDPQQNGGIENNPDAENQEEHGNNGQQLNAKFNFSLFNVTCQCFSTNILLQYLLKFVSVSLNWLFETKEHGNPNKFGLKIEKRRLFLSIGCIAFSYVTYSNIMYELNFDSQQQIQYTLDSFGLNLTWPSNGTIFDNAFKVYNVANLRQTYVLTIACALFWLSFLADVISYFTHTDWKLRFLLLSRLCGIFGGLCIFASIAALAEPNYMAATNFAQICPDCGTQFNAAVKTGAEFIVGLFIGVLFTIKLSPVLFTVAPALVRTSVLILTHPKFEDQRFSQWDRTIKDLAALNRINTVRITLLKGVCVAGGISAIPLTLLAVGILVQYEQNQSTVITLIVLFWSIPLVSLLIFLLLHSITKKSGFLLSAYIVYTLSYFALLVWLICYCLSLYGQLSIISEQLKTFIFYCELISEIFLTNIALSDLLYISLF